jgi:hypothetical protein
VTDDVYNLFTSSSKYLVFWIAKRQKNGFLRVLQPQTGDPGTAVAAVMADGWPINRVK